MGYVHWPMPRRNRKATDGGNAHTRGSGGGWMHPKRSKGKGGKPGPDRAPMTPGSMHSRTRLR